MHLQRKDSLFNQTPVRPLAKRADQSSLNKSLANATSASRPLAILILGSVGAGKSTFLHYTRKVSAKEFFAPRKGELYPHWIDVDFREFTKDGDSKRFIYQNIRNYIDNDALLGDFGLCIKPAYKEQIKALLRGPYKLLADNQSKRDELTTNLIASDYEKLDPYVERVIQWICQHVPIFLVFDNLDQFESPDTQSKIFSDCLALSAKLKCNLIVSMRESTYVAHRRSSVLDAFDFDPIQIDAPEIKPVLSKRFHLASALLKGKSGEFRAYNGAAVSVSDLSVFMDITQKSVLGTEVGDTIELLSVGNVRYGLRMTRDFLARGYTDPAKALSIVKSGQSYTLPRHEAIRALLVGDRQNYSEEYSSVINPFDSRLAKNSSQLLRIYILSSLVKMSSVGAFRSLDGPVILETLESVGFPNADVLQVLNDLCKFSCISTLSHGQADQTSSYYPTRLGGHIVKTMLGDLTFVENVMMDTFIPDPKVWTRLRALSDEIRSERDRTRRLVKRVRRVKVFHEHMSELYSELVEQSFKRSLAADWCTNPFDDATVNLHGKCNNAIRSSRLSVGKRRTKKKSTA